jgi:hypothetical protein
MPEYHMHEDVMVPPMLQGAPAEVQPSLNRTPLHTRQVCYRAFARADGLWDVEGTLLDTKEFQFDRPHLSPLMPGDPVHHMSVVVTVNDDLEIVAIAGRMHTAPLGECQEAGVTLQQLVGQRLGKGWRHALEKEMGGVGGCTHLRELLFNLATAAIQGIPGYRDQRRQQQGLPPLRPTDEVPHYVGGCMTWRRDGPVVKRLMPQFYVPIHKEP